MLEQPEVILRLISSFSDLWDAIALSRVNKRAVSLLTVTQLSASRHLHKGLVCWVLTDSGRWFKGLPSNSFLFTNGKACGVVFTCFSIGEYTDNCFGQFIECREIGRRVAMQVIKPLSMGPIWQRRQLFPGTPFGAFPLLLDATGRFYAGASGKAGTECAGKPQYCPPSDFIVIRKLPLEIRDSEVGEVVEFAPFVSDAHVEHAKHIESVDLNHVSFDITGELFREFEPTINFECDDHDIFAQLKRFLESRELVAAGMFDMRCGCRIYV